MFRYISFGRPPTPLGGIMFLTRTRAGIAAFAYV